MTTRPTVNGHAIMADLPRQNPRALAQNRTSFARSDCWGSAITSPAAAVNVRRAAPPLPFAGSFHGDAAPVEVNTRHSTRAERILKWSRNALSFRPAPTIFRGG